MSSEMWDRRYADPEFAYGREPNDFLVEVAADLPMGRALCLAEGEGRNAVFLAERGFDVSAVDISEVGLDKARAFAAERGTKIQTEVADLAEYSIVPGSFDVIVAIWCHLPASVRRRLFAEAAKGLAPGGAIVVEAYRPAQIGRGTGGPPAADLTYTLAELESLFVDLELERGAEIERAVHEGRYHDGLSAVVQVLAFKR